MNKCIFFEVIFEEGKVLNLSFTLNKLVER